MKPKYVVFDGMDGCGKGTQMSLLQERFLSNVVFTREPGGSGFAEKIRDLLIQPDGAGNSTPLNNFLLFWAAREELLHSCIMPALASGKSVFSDRGDSSTFAFQLSGEQHKRELFQLFCTLRRMVFDLERKRQQPDLYIIFDLPAVVSRQRAMQDSYRTKTHFDARDVEYYERVREGFLAFKDCTHAPVEFVDASRPPALVHESVMEVLNKQVFID